MSARDCRPFLPDLILLSTTRSVPTRAYFSWLAVIIKPLARTACAPAAFVAPVNITSSTMFSQSGEAVSARLNLRPICSSTTPRSQTLISQPRLSAPGYNYPNVVPSNKNKLCANSRLLLLGCFLASLFVVSSRLKRVLHLISSSEICAVWPACALAYNTSREGSLCCFGTRHRRTQGPLLFGLTAATQGLAPVSKPTCCRSLNEKPSRA